MSILDFGEYDNYGDINLDMEYSSSPPFSFIEGIQDTEIDSWLGDDDDVMMQAVPTSRGDPKEMTRSVQEAFQHQLQQQFNPQNQEEVDSARFGQYMSSMSQSVSSAPSFANNSTPPPAPPPLPPNAYLTSSSQYSMYPGEYSPYMYPVQTNHNLSPFLSNSHTQHLTHTSHINQSSMYPRGQPEMMPFYPPPPPSAFNQRKIAPKPPAPPPPGYHLGQGRQEESRNLIQKTPVAASLPQSGKSAKIRCKRRAPSTRNESLRPKQREIRHIQEQFLSSNELAEQLAQLRSQLEASEAESDLLKQRLSNTENELAELRKKVKQFDSMPASQTQMM